MPFRPTLIIGSAFLCGLCSCSSTRFGEVPLPEAFPSSARTYAADSQIRDWAPAFADNLENSMARAEWTLNQIGLEEGRLKKARGRITFWPSLLGGISGAAATYYAAATKPSDISKRVTVGLSLTSATALAGLIPTSQIDDRIKSLGEKKAAIMAARKKAIESCNGFSSVLTAYAGKKQAIAASQEGDHRIRLQEDLDKLLKQAQDAENAANLIVAGLVDSLRD